MATVEAYNEFLDIIDLGLSLGNFIGSSLEDGSFNLLDIREVGPVIEKIGPAIVGGNTALEVIQTGLTEEQYKELEEHIIANFDIPQETIEEAIELAVSLVFQLFKLASVFKK